MEASNPLGTACYIYDTTGPRLMGYALGGPRDRNLDQFRYRNRENHDLPSNYLADKFFPFQLEPKAGQQTLVNALDVEPNLPGDQPDVFIETQLVAFHLGVDERPPDGMEGARAAIQINLNKDDLSQNRHVDKAEYILGAGLDLYQLFQEGDPETRNKVKLQSGDLLGNRPIQIPGGLASMNFRVLLYPREEPPWWRKIFRLANTPAAKAVMGAFGVPGIANTALEIFSDALKVFEDGEPSVLFESSRLTFAATVAAKEALTMDYATIRVFALNSGWYVLARGADFGRLQNTPAYYHHGLGKLVPEGAGPDDLMDPNYQDPFADVSYAVMKVRVKETEISPFTRF